MKFLVVLPIFLLFLTGMQGQDDVLQQSVLAGKAIYKKKCAACHGKKGEGKGKRIPPLSKSDYLRENLNESIRGILFGQEGEIQVNGILYNKKMRAVKLTDEEVANVINFVLHS